MLDAELTLLAWGTQVPDAAKDFVVNWLSEFQNGHVARFEASRDMFPIRVKSHRRKRLLQFRFCDDQLLVGGPDD